MTKFKTVCGVIAFVLFFLMLGAVGAIEQDIVPLFPGMIRVFALMALWVLFCNLSGAFDYKGKYKAASMKRQAQNVIGYMIRTQLRGVRFTRPVVIRYLWVEPSRRRDKDNIAFAKKFIQDALVEAGVLRNDGWSEIEGFSDDFALDPKNPRVEVTIEEYEGGKQNGSKRKN